MQLPEPLVKVTLEKPAIIEEIQYDHPPERPQRSESSGRKSSSDESQSSSESESSGGMGKLVGLLVLAGVGLLFWKRKSGDSSGGQQSGEEKYEHGPEPEIGDQSGGMKGKVAGVLGLVVVTLAVAVLKRRG